MPSAKFKIDQMTGAGAGENNVARQDLWMGHVCDLTATDAPVGATYLWTLLDKPSDSIVTIVNPNAAVAQITPDVWGSYLVRLTINGGTYRNEKTLGIRKDGTGTYIKRRWRIPSFLETVAAANYLLDPGPGYNTRGWAEAVEFILKDLFTWVESGGGGGSGDQIYLMGSTSDATPTEIFVNATPGSRVAIERCTTALLLVTAVRSDNAVMASWQFRASLRQAAGLATLVSYVKEVLTNEIVGADVALGVSGGSLTVTVTGALATNVLWKVRLVRAEVGAS